MRGVICLDENHTPQVSQQYAGTKNKTSEASALVVVLIALRALSLGVRTNCRMAICRMSFCRMHFAECHFADVLFADV